MTLTAPGTPNRLFTREFLTLLATGTTLMMGTGSLLAILPVYVVDELGGTELTAGVVMGSSAINGATQSLLVRPDDRSARGP